MKSATVRDLRNHFGRVSRWLDCGEAVQVVKRGLPYARLVPEPSARRLLGCLAGTTRLPADLEASVPADWEALQ